MTRYDLVRLQLETEAICAAIRFAAIAAVLLLVVALSGCTTMVVIETPLADRIPAAL